MTSESPARSLHHGISSTWLAPPPLGKAPAARTAASPFPMAQAVLLDLDGTLLDTAPDLIGSLNELRAEHGLTALPPGYLAPVVSHGSAPMISRGFDLPPTHAAFEALRKRFLALYRERLTNATRLYAGMSRILEQLNRRGIPWGIVTNKPAWLAQPLVHALGSLRHARCLIAGDTAARRKPDPGPIQAGCRQLGLAPRECLCVGDAQRDVEAAHRAGATAIVALFGYITAEDRPHRWGGDGLIDHPTGILRWLAPGDGTA